MWPQSRGAATTSTGDRTVQIQSEEVVQQIYSSWPRKERILGQKRLDGDTRGNSSYIKGRTWACIIKYCSFVIYSKLNNFVVSHRLLTNTQAHYRICPLQIYNVNYFNYLAPGAPTFSSWTLYIFSIFMLNVMGPWTRTLNPESQTFRLIIISYAVIPL